jgi:hypothetical protein
MDIRRKRRSVNQVREDLSVQVLREKLPEAWVVHSYGEDYGIDCVVELFDYLDEERTVAETLGENIFVQLKSSGSIEYGTRRAYHRGNVAKGSLNEDKAKFDDIPVAKFQLDVPELLTVQAMGVSVPVLLVLVDTDTRKAYFVCLNDYIEKVINPEDPEFHTKGHKTIHIPLANEIANNEHNLIPLRAYGKRSKMYGAFGTFHYQHQEIRRARALTLVAEPASQDRVLTMIKTFTETSLRLDVWSGHEFWKPMGWSQKELGDIQTNVEAGIKTEEFEAFLEYCDTHVWRRLANLSSMYEELVREWFMPTSLALLTSYPEQPAGSETDAQA